MIIGPHNDVREALVEDLRKACGENLVFLDDQFKYPSGLSCYIDYIFILKDPARKMSQICHLCFRIQEVSTKTFRIGILLPL